MSDKSTMPFWEHFDVLRSVLIRMIVVVLALSVGFFIAMPIIFDAIIMAPCRADFPLYAIFDAISTQNTATEPFQVDLINTKLASQLSVHLSTSFELALVVSFPIMIYFLWGFVKPALYERERRHAVKAFMAGNMMFFLGIAVGYFLVFPLTLRFLATYQLSEDIPNMITLDSYMANFTMIILIMGIIFEMPLLAWLLGRMELLTRNFFTTYRRHAVVILLVLAALITPTGDPISLMVVFVPLYLLYELSARFVKPSTT